MITPIRQDKRFMLTVGTVAAVLGLTAAGRAPSEQILTYLVATVTAYVAQSQWGQTKRMTAGTEAGK